MRTKAEVLASGWGSCSRTRQQRGGALGRRMVRSLGRRRRHRDSRVKTVTTRSEGSRNRGSTPGLTCRGCLPRGKHREVGCNSSPRGLPKAVPDCPRGAPADFTPREITGIPVGKCASKLALQVGHRRCFVMDMVKLVGNISGANHNFVKICANHGKKNHLNSPKKSHM